MTPLFQKLNLKEHREILVVGAPGSLESELGALDGVAVHRSWAKLRRIDFALVFVTTQKELDRAVHAIAKKASGDIVLWFAYPKKSSKKYRCEIDRDHGWGLLGDAGFEGVRSAAIDEDWSGIRFRRVEFIHKITRDPKHALSAEGKKRGAKGTPPR